MTSPRLSLAEIRTAELAAARSVAGATETAGQAIADARRTAGELADDARQQGRALADVRFASTVAEAEADAARIAHELEQRIVDLRDRVEPELDRLVEAMVGVILPGTE